MADLILLADVTARLGPNYNGSTEDDDLLGDLISQMSAWVEQTCGRAFIVGDTTITADGWDAFEGGYVLPVRQGIRTLTTLEVAEYTGAAFQTVTAGTYFLRPTASRRNPGWPAMQVHLSDQGSFRFYAGYDNVRLTGTFGWAAVPDDVKEIATTAVVRAWHARQAGQQDIIGNDEYGRPIVSRYVSKRDRDTLARYDAHELAIG